MNKKIKILAGLILAMSSVLYSYAGTCYYSHNQDTIIIGNEIIERQWIWKDGNLYPTKIKNKDLKTEYLETDIPISPENSVIPLSTSLEQYTHQQNSIANEEFQVIAIASFTGYDKKIILSIKEKSPAIRVQYFFMIKKEFTKIPELETQVLDSFSLPSIHYTIKSVEFFDRTDVNNNLVQENIFLPFLHPFETRGNILFAESNLDQGSFFVIKEAPCSFVQLNYQGLDFIVDKEKIFVIGNGLTNTDMLLNTWVSSYASVIGVVPANTPPEYALRSYQKTLRRHLPERDEMIMMNTWGDRNRDASINENFCLKEIDACVKYGFTHFQIDDGWQTGLSKNSANSGGRLWDQWEEEHWQPHPERFPNGLGKVVDYADKHNIKLGLWFHPSNHQGYANWKKDAVILANLSKKYGINAIKIDGVKLPDKKSEINFRNFLNHTLELTDNKIVFNLDATADNRGGYHYFYEFGNIFLENRYTDWANYYPHWTLRNLWQLSKYVPPEKLQIEFLNILRNTAKYTENDPLAPSKIPFNYTFATTMAAQPLAWFEGSNLPAELDYIAQTISGYKKVWNDFHEGHILPIGGMPDGSSWTGFQSIINEGSGYFLVFREDNPNENTKLNAYFLSDINLKLTQICGSGSDNTERIDKSGGISFHLPSSFSFVLYKYETIPD